MKICVLQPDYSPSAVDYKNYDPRRDLARLLPGHTVDHVALNKLTTYRQLKKLSKQGYDIFVNLCEGYLEWDVPSIDVIHSLELLNLPYTGPTPALYDPPKELMKYVAYTVGVQTPPYVLVEDVKDLAQVKSRLRYPLFIKPAKAGDSLGVDDNSLVFDAKQLRRQVAATLEEYPELLVEEFIDGREFTVLVVGDPEGGHGCTSYTPVEFIFPEGRRYKTYALKTSELHPEANIPVRDAELAARLKRAAERVFRGFDGVGYARMDFRMNDRGELFFLEINFTCSVFYSDGYEGSADYILKHDRVGQAGFAKHIVAEGIARHRRRQRPFVIKGNALSGYGIYATRAVAPNEIVFRGEERSQRIASREHVMSVWSDEDQLQFRRYAYPLSDEVYVLWDENPAEWAPQNHSCEPNTGFHGLNVVALRPIARGEELTLNYGELLNEESEPFECHCGAASCRGLVTGTAGNSIGASAIERSG
ncbi:MAG: SET domain-containing protein-lysine N-methyltransferase [bacterium]